MDWGHLVRFEWLMLELLVLAWAFWELYSLRRERLKREAAEAAAKCAQEEAPPR